MNKLPGFTSELSLYKSNNRYFANYSKVGMTNNGRGVYLQAIIGHRGASTSIESPCLNVCIWANCDADDQGGIDLGCFLYCLKICSGAGYNAKASSRLLL